jgi:uncharacterized membrane protein
MDSELTPEEKFNAENPERMVPRALREGRSREAIIADLVRLDWTPAAAAALVERAARDLALYQSSPESRAALVAECRMQMIGGFTVALIGIFCTIASLVAALVGVHVWVIFVGMVLLGLILGTRGYTRWRFYRRDSLSR